MKAKQTIHCLPSLKGFTLIELSIVLVIIGLVIGGVLVGKDLINSSGNRAFVSQLETYNAVVNTFKNKYNCLPGDCASATAYGFANNGNGNGMVTAVSSFPSWTASDYISTNSDTSSYIFLGWIGVEADYFWQHLRSALLIPEYKTTLVVADGVGVGFSLPTAKNDDTGIAAFGWQGKHYFRSGAIATRQAGNIIWTMTFSPADAAYIFTKMGGTTITTTFVHGMLYPDSISKERVIISDAPIRGAYGGDHFIYTPPSFGTGGANANYCIDNSVTPAYFNLKNPAKLCSLIIQANF